ncbi:flagellar basal body rod protein FlgB [Paraferrimonas sedimenticola]|uniref:Flagellar basal body rod protein FlgB n=1 Tax=Paraferrimonas sedimenticola TaxID=375674 RepID=A0AA37RS19_9GAMM|nr:flagellar basal body rod protein FlgB [Paraferrimonas sedimenticola]GLP94995.1 flagellar basal body rod protein FlgB [Paraferrimonas sedimenticola]
MAINFDKALGIHQHSLGLRAQRAEVLASNIANADTPGYKAQDLDFQQALRAATSSTSAPVGLSATDQRHLGLDGNLSPHLKYRTPNQADTGDGNSVDVQKERNEYVRNAMEYQMSFTFLDSKFSGLRKAIRGD